MTKKRTEEQRLKRNACNKKYYETHPEARERRKQICREWRKLHEGTEERRDYHAARIRKYLKTHPEARERHRQIVMKWRKNNPEKIKEQKIKGKKWRYENYWLIGFMSARKMARKLNQLPKWADMDKIKEFYRQCPRGMTVDHIVPFCGKNVRGLHVLNNLQYLTPLENSKKWIHFPYEVKRELS